MWKPVLFGGSNARRLQPSVLPSERLACALPQSVHRSTGPRRWLLPNSFGVPDR